MNETDRVLRELAMTQHHVFSRAQTRAAGMPPSTLRSRVRSGALVACGVNALHVGGVALTEKGVLMAGLLDLGSTALVSGAAAAHLHGLDGFGPGAREFLVERAQRSRRTDGTVHSLSSFERLDRTVIDGLACTSATMTVVQLLATATAEQATNALDSACRMRLTAVPVIARRLGRLGRQGRGGVTLFERIVDEAIVDSWLERRFLQLLRDAGLPVPVAQRRHQLEGVGVVRVDFEFTHLPIVIEVGGRLGYLSTADRQRKERRRNAVQLAGRTIYFFTRNDVVHDPAYVVATVAAALAGRSAAAADLERVISDATSSHPR